MYYIWDKIYENVKLYTNNYDATINIFELISLKCMKSWKILTEPTFECTKLYKWQRKG